MRYRATEIFDVVRDGRRARAFGTVICMDANPSATGPNRVPVARYTGPLTCVNDAACDSTGDWQPVGARGDHPERWSEIA